MKSKLSRRVLLKTGVAFGFAQPLAVLWPSGAMAAAAPLDPNDPAAKALGFINDASKVDTSANPNFKPAQKCATCVQYQGKSSDPSAACNLFPGKSVPGSGWCKVWAAKP